ncbi:MAG TPA: hypothetical protein VKG43_07410 [Acidimicrobiales bacterium]|nr:hypothetical protein [Acidimicrobiales bacterium]
MPGVRRPELVALAAILVSLPSLPAALSGAISPAAALIRFGIALALCWAGGALVERVYDTYARQSRQREIERIVSLMKEARTRGAPPAADRHDTH